MGVNINIGTVRVGGLDITPITRQQLARLMVQDCAVRSSGTAPKLVFSANGEAIARAGFDPRFREAMDGADLIHADGMAAVFASRLGQRRKLPERVATTDFFHDAAAAAEAQGLSFYFLGGREEQNKAAVEAVRRSYPELRIAGRWHGFFAPHETKSICAGIRNSGADVLWVGLGRPLQELWASENRHRLEGVGWVKTCGGLFSFLSGDAKRAPLWVQRSGLEWSHRLMWEPRRLGPRYAKSNVQALYRMLVDGRRGGR